MNSRIFAAAPTPIHRSRPMQPQARERITKTLRLCTVVGAHSALLLAALAAAPSGNRVPLVSDPVMISFVDTGRPNAADPESVKPTPQPRKKQAKSTSAPAQQRSARPVPAPEPLTPGATDAHSSLAAPVAAPPTATAAALPNPSPPVAVTETAPPAAPLPESRPPPLITSGLAYIRAPVPEYPAVARRLGEQGHVVVRVLINERGYPEQADVHESAGSARLDEAARRAVLRAVFQPHIESGRAIAAYALVPIRFQLN